MTLNILLILLVILIAIYAGCVHISLIRFKTTMLEILDAMQQLEKKAFEHQLELIKDFVHKDDDQNNRI